MPDHGGNVIYIMLYIYHIWTAILCFIGAGQIFFLEWPRYFSGMAHCYKCTSCCFKNDGEMWQYLNHILYFSSLCCMYNKFTF
jgi:hypothetical protein